MRNTTWHVHVRVAQSMVDVEGAPETLPPGEYSMREVDLSSYEIRLPGGKAVRLGLSDVLKLHRAGAIQIDGAFP
jgi:hypothetical protein